MSDLEVQRHRLFQALEETIGTEPTSTLMNYLPPVGWADVATKSDLDSLRVATKTELELRLAAQDHKFEALLHIELRKQFQLIIGANATMLAVFVAVTNLL